MKQNLQQKIFFRLLSEKGIERPYSEYKFHPDRKWRFDYCFPNQKLAIEIEGGVWIKGRHTRGSGFVKDMEKYNNAAVLGYRLLRFQPNDLTKKETINTIYDIIKNSR